MGISRTKVPVMVWSVVHRSRFVIRSTYDALPSPSNIAIWGLSTDSRCVKCQQRGTLQHTSILCACPKSFGSGMYTWRHNQVLTVIGKFVQDLVTKFNTLPLPSNTRPIGIPFEFVKLRVPQKQVPRQSLWAASCPERMTGRFCWIWTRGLSSPWKSLSQTWDQIW